MTTIDRTHDDVTSTDLWSAMGTAARDVAWWRNEAKAFRKLALSWRKNPTACSIPREAETFAETADAKAAGASTMEASMLAILNGTILEAGGVAGQVWEVKDHLYRVVNPGNPSVCLGRCIPETPSEALNAIDSVFDDSWMDRDEAAERAAEYSQMVDFNAR